MFILNRSKQHRKPFIYKLIRHAMSVLECNDMSYKNAPVFNSGRSTGL